MDPKITGSFTIDIIGLCYSKINSSERLGPKYGWEKAKLQLENEVFSGRKKLGGDGKESCKYIPAGGKIENAIYNFFVYDVKKVGSLLDIVVPNSPLHYRLWPHVQALVPIMETRPERVLNEAKMDAKMEKMMFDLREAVDQLDEAAKEALLLPTVAGKTQNAGTGSEKDVQGILRCLGYTFHMAGTQQPKDFRNINGTGIDIEVKHCDSKTFKLNDTLPGKTIYIMIFTAKKTTAYTPRVIIERGDRLVGKGANLARYQAELGFITRAFSHAKSPCYKLTENLKGFVRPNYDLDVTQYLTTKPKKKTATNMRDELRAAKASGYSGKLAGNVSELKVKCTDYFGSSWSYFTTGKLRTSLVWRPRSESQL